MPELFNVLPLPDDRPITSICLVEDCTSCPPNHIVVSKTHDQDIDADLCKDGFFRRVTRYLTYSKVDSYLGYVVEQIIIVADKESRMPGYTIIEQTIDTYQRSFKKKQLCYKAVPLSMASQIITDIIILSHSKVAPEGFVLVGEMNGLCICYKANPNYARQSQASTGSPLPYSINPSGSRSSIGSSTSGNERLYPYFDGKPTRQAPEPPMLVRPASATGYPCSDASTLYGSGQNAVSGVPFTLSKKYVSNLGELHILPRILSKSTQQLNDEYYYSFALEQDIVEQTKT